MGKNKTHEKFAQEVYDLVGDEYSVLGKYVNAKTKILLQHNYDKCNNYIFEILPNKFLGGRRCLKCAGNKRKTHEEFINELNLISPEIIILNKYKNSHTKLKCKCSIDGNIWECTPSNLLIGRGCSKCNKKYKRSHEEFIKEIKNINKNIKILSKFISTNEKVTCECLIDGHVWDVRSSALLNGVSCPKCSGRLVSHEDFIDKMKIINDNIFFISEYTKCNSKIKCKCLIDNNEWEATPDNLLQGYGCPKCNFSKGEKKIDYILNQNNVCFDEQYKFDECRNINPLPFDFIIYENNKEMKLKCLIEYHGIQHYKSVEFFGGEDQFVLQQNLDKIKFNYCHINNIRLIVIPYWDFDNIEEILKKELKLAS